MRDSVCGVSVFCWQRTVLMVLFSNLRLQKGFNLELIKKSFDELYCLISSKRV